jgi:hypothetical protein
MAFQICAFADADFTAEHGSQPSNCWPDQSLASLDQISGFFGHSA